MKHALNSEAGFTLIELMLAMTLFIAVMVISTIGFVGMNKTFTRGMIRKQLSEAVQTTVQDMSLTMQASPHSSGATLCTSGTDGCSGEVNAICMLGARYYWPADASAGGLYKDGESCGSGASTQARQLMDGRYRVRALEVNPLTDNGLFRIRGSYSTLEESAITKDDDTSEFSARCKGSAETNEVQTCAAEQFDVVVNARGEAI